MLRVLKDYDIRILTSNVDVDGKVLENITPDSWYAYDETTKVLYATKINRSNQILKEIQVFDPDFIYSIGIFSWHFTCVPMLFGKRRHRILSVRGMLHSGALKQKALKKNIYLAGLKTLSFGRRAVFHATDDIEAQYIKEVFGKNVEVKVAANLPNFFIPVPNPDKEAGTLSLVTICLISPMKNILLILKALLLSRGKIEYHIYGAIKDEGYWENCLSVISEMKEDVRIVYHGAIKPSGVEKILELYDVYIQPSVSENFGHSMAEALSAGLPVITSNKTPWQSLAENKAGINIKPTEEDLAAAINKYADMTAADFAEHAIGAARYIREKVSLEKVEKDTRGLFSLSA